MIITASDINFLPGVRLLAETFNLHRQPAGLRVYAINYDPFGMPESRQLMKDFPRLEFVPVDYPTDHLGWQALAKPSCILHDLKQHGRTIWIDADCAVNTSLSLPWQTLTTRPWFVQHDPTFGFDHFNDAAILAKNGITLKPWTLKVYPTSAVCGFAITPTRDDTKFVRRWKELCDNWADGWAYLDQGPFTHMVAQYKHKWISDPKKWNIMAGVVGRTRDETLANLPNGIRHFAGRAKPWISWAGQLELEEKQRELGITIQPIEPVKQVRIDNKKKASKERPKNLVNLKVPERKPQNIDGVGTEFKTWAKLRPCDQCMKTMEKMNQLGPIGCDQQFDSLVEEIFNNAKVRGAVTSLLTHIPGAKKAVKFALHQSIDAVVERIHSNTEIITTHFNPCKFNRTKQTYYEWLPKLGPHAAIVKCYELVFDDDEPEIEGSIVIRGSREKHWLWQKEALLNVGIKNSSAANIIIADHDLYTDDGNWLARALHSLKSNDAVQLFSEIKYENEAGEITHSVHSAMKQINTPHKNPGGMWAIRRKFLESVGGLPWDNIVGGGDNAWLMAMANRDWYLTRLSEPHKATTLAWANRARELEPQFTHESMTWRHIWHGDMKTNRNYVHRHDAMIKFNYDPTRDVRLNEDGIIEWTGNNKPLEKAIRDYFMSRREDG